MKEALITILRELTTSIEQYRRTADQLATILAIEAAENIPKVTVPVETPLTNTMGVHLAQDVVLVPILRSGLVLLSPFLHFYPHSRVGFIGTCRNEVTAVPQLYYSKLPPLSAGDQIFLLDPMIATGGSAIMAIDVLKKAGALESQITLISYLAAPEGIAHLKKECPKSNIIVAHVDEKLDAHKRIIPGLGDFGDRYFGSEF